MKSVSGKYLCKILEQHGWRLQRISGSHYIYENDGVEAIAVVPVHANRDMRIGHSRPFYERRGLRNKICKPLLIPRITEESPNYFAK